MVRRDLFRGDSVAAAVWSRQDPLRVPDGISLFQLAVFVFRDPDLRGCRDGGVCLSGSCEAVFQK